MSPPRTLSRDGELRLELHRVDAVAAHGGAQLIHLVPVHPHVQPVVPRAEHPAEGVEELLLLFVKVGMDGQEEGHVPQVRVVLGREAGCDLRVPPLQELGSDGELGVVLECLEVLDVLLDAHDPGVAQVGDQPASHERGEDGSQHDGALLGAELVHDASIRERDALHL